jgi:hypothetical protein
MAFALVQSGDTGAGGTGIFPTQSPTAGNIIVVAINWEGNTGANDTTVVQNGGSSFVMGTRVDTSGGDHHSQLGYLFDCTTTNIFDFTFPTNTTSPAVAMAEFSSSDTESFDTQNTGSGSGLSLASGSINLGAAANWLVLGLGGSYTSSSTFSAHQINGTNADGSQAGSSGGGGGVTLFWRLLSASFTGGTATCTQTANDDWVCNILSLKAGVGVAIVTEQEGFRFRNDDGSESTATWKQNQDVNATIAVDQNFRLRFLINKR